MAVQLSAHLQAQRRQHARVCASEIQRTSDVSRYAQVGTNGKRSAPWLQSVQFCEGQAKSLQLP